MEKIIIYKAIEALEDTTPLKAEWVEAADTKGQADGNLLIVLNNKKHTFILQLKKNIRTVNIPQLTRLKEEYNDLLVIAEVIYPNIGEQLRKRHINYLDTIGNFYIQQGGLFLLKEGKKTGKQAKKLEGRAFNKAGLKFIYYLLTDIGFINKTYREMGEVCNTALGNINYIINDLKNQDFLRQRVKKRYYLYHREELIKKWVINYEKKLKPAYLLGVFRFPDKGQMINWKELDIDYRQTKWGGEPAADILTNYLKPEILTLYTKEKRIEMMKKYRLIPDDKGYLKIFNMFWDTNENNTKTVHPLVVYADLVNTGDPRTDELANMIYDEYLTK